MKKSRFTGEQIVAALREAEATTVVGAARKYGVACQPLFTGFEEILAPAVIQIAVDAFAATQLSD